MATNEENIDDQPVHTVTKEQLAARLEEIFGGGGIKHQDANWDTALEIYTFMHSINPQRAESWARSYRRLCGYRD